MDWDKKSLSDLVGLFRKKHYHMRAENRTDRRNFSAIWNKYLENYGVVLISDLTKSNKPYRSRHLQTDRMLANLIDMVNFRNGAVADALVIDNPDRPGQYLLVQKDMAERIFVLGML